MSTKKDGIDEEKRRQERVKKSIERGESNEPDMNEIVKIVRKVRSKMKR